MTYTLGRRALRTFNDRGAKAADKLDTDMEVVEVFLTLTIKLVMYAVLVPLYIVAAPFMLINWVSDRRTEKAKAKDKAERYQRYLEKQTQK